MDTEYNSKDLSKKLGVDHARLKKRITLIEEELAKASSDPLSIAGKAVTLFFFELRPTVYRGRTFYSYAMSRPAYLMILSRTPGREAIQLYLEEAARDQAQVEQGGGE